MLVTVKPHFRKVGRNFDRFLKISINNNPLLSSSFRRRGGTQNEKRNLLTIGDRTARRSKKFSSDPTEIHRNQCSSPAMVQHPPIHVNSLHQHVEDLKANCGIKFLKEFEVGPSSSHDMHIILHHKYLMENLI